MKQYNEIAVAKSGKDAKKGTTVDELKSKLGKANWSSDTSYSWYTNYTKSNYFRVTINDQD